MQAKITGKVPLFLLFLLIKNRIAGKIPLIPLPSRICGQVADINGIFAVICLQGASRHENNGTFAVI